VETVMDNDTEAEPVGSSRIYVAGLPTYLDEKRLRDTFSERGEVTDAKIMRTRFFPALAVRCTMQGLAPAVSAA